MNYRVASVFVCLIFFCVGFFFGFRRYAGPDAYFDFYRERNVLTVMLKQSGTRAMYDYVKTAYVHNNPIAVHSLMHWVGEMIYKTDGMNGLLLCDDSYNWGCFHGFFGKAIALERSMLLAQADAVCTLAKKNTSGINGCFHGIGHGLLAYAGGYEKNNLTRALETCNRLSKKTSQTSCYNGVFMEYNLRTMQDTEHGGGQIREYHAANPYEPCDSLSEPYLKDCYFEQTDWWRLVMNRNFTTMGALCAGLVNAEAKDGCYRGIGRGIWGESKFSPNKSVADCTSLLPDEGIWPCLSVTVEGMVLDKREADEFCPLFGSTYEKHCIAHSSLFSNSL